MNACRDKANKRAMKALSIAFVVAKIGATGFEFLNIFFAVSWRPRLRGGRDHRTHGGAHRPLAHQGGLHSCAVAVCRSGLPCRLLPAPQPTFWRRCGHRHRRHWARSWPPGLMSSRTGSPGAADPALEGAGPAGASALPCRPPTCGLTGDCSRESAKGAAVGRAAAKATASPGE